MELRSYLSILRRRLWIVVAMSLIHIYHGEKIPENDLENRVEFLKKSLSKGCLLYTSRCV